MPAPSARRFRVLIALFFACFALAQAAYAQFWEKKPYQKWSKDEVQKMLSDSPWAREVVLSNVTGSTVNVATRGRVAQGANDQLGAQVTYQVQIRTAKPMRQAVVRGAQLSPRYEQMDAEHKKRIDANAEQFINASSEEISFWVSYSCNVENFNSDLQRYWQNVSQARLINTIWLEVPGAEKVAFNYFAPGPDRSFELRFPRPKEMPAKGSMVLEFQHPDGLAGQKQQKVLVEFKTGKLTLAGAPAY